MVMYGSDNYTENYKFLHVVLLTVCGFSLNWRFSECELLINTSPAYVKMLKNYPFPRHTLCVLEIICSIVKNSCRQERMLGHSGFLWIHSIYHTCQILNMCLQTEAFSALLMLLILLVKSKGF